MKTLVWTTDIETAGTGFVRELDLPLDKLAKVSGQDPFKSGMLVDDDKGYDGWRLMGTFDGARFTLYRRWGILRLGAGTEGTLDVAGLVDALRAAVASV
jgi:hypothetical protein